MKNNKHDFGYFDFGHYELKFIVHFPFLPHFFIHKSKLYISMFENITSVYERFEGGKWKLKRRVIHKSTMRPEGLTLEY